jgi:hypothetical protein
MKFMGKPTAKITARIMAVPTRIEAKILYGIPNMVISYDLS